MEETFEEAFEGLVQKGLLEVAGVTEDGELTFQLTEAGKIVAEELERRRDDPLNS